eukprot:553724-Pleurochrysis_carterae.AAC.1
MCTCGALRAPLRSLSSKSPRRAWVPLLDTLRTQSQPAVYLQARPAPVPAFALLDRSRLKEWNRPLSPRCQTVALSRFHD